MMDYATDTDGRGLSVIVATNSALTWAASIQERRVVDSREAIPYTASVFHAHIIFCFMLTASSPSCSQPLLLRARSFPICLIFSEASNTKG